MPSERTRKAMSRIVGIDLGTTNSLVGYVDETTGLPRVIPDAEGRVLLPSVVSFTREGVLVGKAAKRLLVRRPATTIYSVKRLMGRGYEDIKEELCYLPFKVAPCDGIVKIQVEDREVTPPQVSAIVLKSLKERAEKHFGEPIEKAVITVPAYFNDSQRQATKDAGRIAGLDVVRIVNEPTAASLAYGLHRLKEGVIAVYDLGGGTFDISILRVKDGVFEVLATNGNTHLGGDDFDRAIVVWLLDDIRSKHGVYLGRDSEAMQELRLAAEAAKIRLSVDERAALTIPFDGFTYHREIARTELEELIGKLVDSTLGPCRVALADASLGSSDIDEVVLVGGSTRVPLLRRRVRELFGKTPHSQLNPDEVVALGAAVQAHILAGGITSMLLLDVTPLSLGIETLGGIVSVLIPRNTTIPTSAREMFTTSVDGQTVVDMHVVQGERELAKDNRSLARFELRGVDPMPAGMPKIEVTFLIDANGILQVQAREQRTGKAAAIEVKPTYGLTEGDVERMVEDSFTYAEADVETRLLIETRNEADTVLTHVERALRQAGPLLDIALANDIHLEHNCGGSCACTTCHVIVKDGAENLSEMQEDEEDRLDTAVGLTIRSRLGCQAIVQGDVVVEIPE